MGMHPAPRKCHITGLPTVDRGTPIDEIDYCIQIKDNSIHLKFESMHQNSDFVEKNKHILFGLLLNNLIDTSKPLNNSSLERYINDSNYPRNPKDKLDNLLRYINSLLKFEGDFTEITHDNIVNDYIAQRLYFRDINEFYFYLDSLKEKGYVTFEDTEDGNILLLKVTFLGFNYLIELERPNEKSLNCFIAMSFNEDLCSIKNTIKSVCIKTGFYPILVNEVHYSSELTINDAIISEIKKCKFCIADFTEQKDGVYFEAGYALGKGKEVIYTCRKDWFEQCHFDTKHFPYIIYDSETELEQKLINKINAWIK